MNIKTIANNLKKIPDIEERIGTIKNFVRELSTMLYELKEGEKFNFKMETIRKELDKWFKGNSSNAPKITKKQKEEVNRLFAETIITTLHYYQETDIDYEASSAAFEIGGWKSESHWEYSNYKEIYHHWTIKDIRTDIYNNDKKNKDDSIEEVAKKIETTLPPVVLLYYIYLVAFDFVNYRPYADYIMGILK